MTDFRAVTPYVAPAGVFPVTLHRPDGSRTRCGLPMPPEERWRPVMGKDAQSLCTGCMLPGGGAHPADDWPDLPGDDEDEEDEDAAAPRPVRVVDIQGTLL